MLQHYEILQNYTSTQRNKNMQQASQAWRANWLGRYGKPEVTAATNIACCTYYVPLVHIYIYTVTSAAYFSSLAPQQRHNFSSSFHNVQILLRVMLYMNFLFRGGASQERTAENANFFSFCDFVPLVKLNLYW